MVAKRTGVTGCWTDGHRRVLCSGRHTWPRRGDWALVGVSTFRDGRPDYDVPPAILASMRQAWSELGELIMRDWSDTTRKPFAFWIFDSPEKRDLAMHEAEQLYQLGLLSDDVYSDHYLQMSIESYRVKRELIRSARADNNNQE
jgi:hypothetical protein